jgi:hypothetical protein
VDEEPQSDLNASSVGRVNETCFMMNGAGCQRRWMKMNLAAYDYNPPAIDDYDPDECCTLRDG